MDSDMQHRRAALKTRVVGVLTTGVAVGLVLVPVAGAADRLTANHSETVLALD